MHVGVCIRVEAKSEEEAKDIADMILHKYSVEEADANVMVNIPIESIFEEFFPDAELNPESIQLICETNDIKNELITFLNDEVGSRYFYDFWDESSKIKKEIIDTLMNELDEDRLGNFTLNWFDEDSVILKRDAETNYITSVDIEISGIIFEGVWDYTYGLSQYFEDENYKIIPGPAWKNLNKDFINDLMADNEKCVNVVDYWVNENEEISSSGNIEFVKDMFSNTTKNTYFMTGSVHI